MPLGMRRIGVSKAMEALGRNPEAAGAIFVPYILGLALTEAIGIYALVIGLLLMFVSVASDTRRSAWASSSRPSASISRS